MTAEVRDCDKFWLEMWDYVSTLPATELTTYFGTPAFKVKGKFMARLWEDGETLVLRLDFETVAMLLISNPEVFYITDHYAGYPAVLVRLPIVDKDELCELLEQSWRLNAPKKILDSYPG